MSINDTCDYVVERIKEARKNAGLSLKTLSARTGVSQATLSRWEHGTASPDVRGLALLGAVYHVDPTWFFPPTSPAANLPLLLRLAAAEIEATQPADIKHGY